MLAAVGLAAGALAAVSSEARSVAALAGPTVVMLGAPPAVAAAAVAAAVAVATVGMGLRPGL